MESVRELIFVSQARQRALHNYTTEKGWGEEESMEAELMRIPSPNGQAFIGTGASHA